jgi:acyl-CoA synthetase (NDP forming)
VLPGFATVANPLDYNTSLWGDRSALLRCFSAMLADPYDAALLIIDYPHEGIAGRAECDISVDALIEAAGRAGMPAIVASTLPELLPADARARILAAGAAPLQGLPEALAAIAAAMRYGGRRGEIGRSGARALALPPAAPLAPGRRTLDEAQSKAELAAHGLAIPAGRAVPAADAVRAAEDMRFPLAMKVLAPFLAHKTEAGAVALDLGTPAAVATALASMNAALARGGHGPVETVLIEEMVTDAVAELIVGVVRDDRLGLALVIGGGGILVELAKDTQRLLLPASREAIAAALSRLAAAKLLSGYRGRPAGDAAAAVDAIAAVAAFAEANRDRLVELDVNPLLVRPQGSGAVAVDALVRIAVP